MDHVKNAQSCVECLHTLHDTFSGTYENQCPHFCVPLDPKFLILIWNTGVSFVPTPFRSDFIDYVKYEIPVRDITMPTKLLGLEQLSISL
jgi:hypothetical protein